MHSFQYQLSTTHGGFGLLISDQCVVKGLLYLPDVWPAFFTRKFILMPCLEVKRN